MSSLIRVRDVAHYHAGKDKGLEWSGVGNFFSSGWASLTNTRGSFGTTILGWVLKVILGIVIVGALECCITACCGRICSKTFANVIEKQLIVPGPMEELTRRENVLDTEVENPLYELMDRVQDEGFQEKGFQSSRV